MSEALSPNAKAILLLTAPLIAGRGKKSDDLLTVGEYKKLARHLIQVGSEPADLLTPAADHLLGECHRVIDKARLERLLGRGFALSQAVEHWQARAIWVVSRADASYPQRLKARLKEDCPPLLFGCGERTLVDSGGLAVVGSRHVDDSIAEYAQEIGRLAAFAKQTVVSGGAKGIDQAAMRGALEAGGRATGILSDSLERAATNRENRGFLLDERLVLISPYDPGAGFNVGNAMQRNKLIYALADAALVVSADFNKGGTWAGATEQLEKWRFITVYVRSTGETSKGLDALKKKGAVLWPNPTDADVLNELLASGIKDVAPGPRQSQLSFTSPQPDVVREHPESGTTAAETPADELLRAVRSSILRVLHVPRKASEVARELGVTQRQAEEWLKKLTREELLEKSKKPVRYSARQAGLFDAETSGSRE